MSRFAPSGWGIVVAPLLRDHSVRDRSANEPMTQAIQPAAPATAAQSAVRAKAQALLTPGEEVLGVAAQTDIARWWVMPPDGVVITNHRILFLKIGFFSFSFTDFHWEHVTDIHVLDKFAGSTLSASASASKSGYATQAMVQATAWAALQGLVKPQAHEAYRLGQHMEQQWREVVRGRIMQERQVERGAYLVQTPVAPAGYAPMQTPQAPGATDAPEVRLQKLKGLLDQGLIDQQEFERKKAQILASL